MSREEDAGALHRRGVELFRGGAPAAAIEALQHAVRLAPDDAAIWNTLGAILVEAGHADFAERALRQALRIDPGYREAAFNLAVALRKQGLASLARGDTATAARAFQSQVALDRTSRPAHQNLAIALLGAERVDDAIAALEDARAAGHRDAELLSMLVNAKGQACDWEGLDDLIEELRGAARDEAGRPANPQTAQYLAEVTAAEQREWAERYARTRFAGFTPIERPTPASRGGPLRVGYISGDFRDHATAWLVVGLFENHDRGRFRVHAYSTGRPSASSVRDRIGRAVDSFVDVHGLDTRATAQRIAADAIDVLIDLGGYTGGSPIDVLACRPAPVQGHFLGYPGTTGAPFVDFFVADAVTVPRGAESTFTERVLRMPHCCQPNDPKLAIPARPRRSDVGLPDDAIVLCSFNQPVKLRPMVFNDWCRMLSALPRAVLWLRDPGAGARARLQKFASARGIDASRIVYAAHVSTREAHLERLATADLALDPFPYGSHTNANDALWAGVPLVTRRGETFASRVGASLLHSAGLDDWAFDDPREGYEKVVAMASDRKGLSDARERVEAARTSVLFDSKAFTRDFESLLVSAARPAP